MPCSMKQHMALSNQFTSVHEKTLSLFEQAPSTSPRAYVDANERLLSLQIALKLADVGSTCEGHEVRE